MTDEEFWNECTKINPKIEQSRGRLNHPVLVCREKIGSLESERPRFKFKDICSFPVVLGKLFTFCGL